MLVSYTYKVATNNSQAEVIEKHVLKQTLRPRLLAVGVVNIFPTVVD